MARLVYFDLQDGSGYRNVSSLIKYDSLNINIRACSDNYHYAQNTASFELIYDATIFGLLQANTADVLVRITEDGTALFTGHIPQTRAYTYNGILNNISISMEAVDDGDYLDKPIGGTVVGTETFVDICYRGYQIMNATASGTSIVHQLAYRAGFTNAQIDSNVVISETLNAFTPPSSSDSIKDLMDTLLFEYGYVLHFNEAGQISPVRWINAAAPTAYWSMDSVPEIPDDPAGVTYLQDAWANDDGWLTAGGGSVSASSGVLHWNRTGSNQYMVIGLIGPGTKYRIRVRLASGTMTDSRLFMGPGGGGVASTTAIPIDGSWAIIDVTTSNPVANAVIYTHLATSDAITLEIDWIYIGTGAYLPNSLIDNSGNGNHGTIYGATPVTGISGKALAFDGVNDYCYATPSISGNEYSVSMIIKPEATTINSGLFLFGQLSYSGMAFVKAANTSNFVLYIYRSTTQETVATVALTLGISHHVVISYNVSTKAYAIYDNGALIASGITVYTGVMPTNVFYLGYDSFTTDYFNGTIDEPRIYNRALSAEEVRYLYAYHPGVTDSFATSRYDETNIINELRVQDSLKTYKGAEVVYYELAEGVTTSGQTDILLYRDSELPYTSNGSFLGYPVLSGYTYPPETNVIDELTGERTKVYQVYEDNAIQYWTNAAIKNKLDYSYKAFTSDFSSIVATSGWRLDYDAGDNVALATSEFYNTQARVVYSGMAATDNNLYYSNIYGKVLYKTAERTSKIELETNASDINEYVSTFIFDKTDADVLVKAMATQYEIPQKLYTLTTDETIIVGALVDVVAGDGTSAVCYVMSRSYDEVTELWTYSLKHYSSDTPALTSQTTTHASSVTANTMLQTFATKAVVDTTISGTVTVMIPDLAPAYLGLYEHAHPASYNPGDWWTVYHSDDTAPQRGVWYSNNGTPARITASSTPALQAKFSVALTDVAWAEEQGTYGTSADYGIEALFQSLGAVTAFINSLFVNEITVPTGGTIRYETGSGVQKRCVQLADEKIDWLDTPDTSPATPEQLRFRIGRLGVGGAVLADGELYGNIDSPWSPEALIFTGACFAPEYINRSNGEVRVLYQRDPAGYLYICERVLVSGVWSAETIITDTYPDLPTAKYIEMPDGELRVYIDRVYRIWDGSSWGAPISDGASGMLYDLIVTRDGTMRRLEHEAGLGTRLMESIWNGSSWGSQGYVSDFNVYGTQYVELDDGTLTIVFRRVGTDGYLVTKKIVSGSWEADASATVINNFSTSLFKCIKQINGELFVAYIITSSGYLGYKQTASLVWGSQSTFDTVGRTSVTVAQAQDGLIRIAACYSSTRYLYERTLQRYAQIGAGIIESGGDDTTGRYIKYGDGTMECWVNATITIAGGTTDAAISSPAVFIDVAKVVGTVGLQPLITWTGVTFLTGAWNSYSGGWFYHIIQGATGQDYNIQARAIGRWKT